MEDKLTIIFDTHEPIPVDTFCKALTALQDEYSSVTQNSSKLLIKEIRKGSIEIDLITVASIAILPFMTNANTVFQFIDYLSSSIRWLSGKEKTPSEIKYSMKELQNFKELFAPVVISNTDNSMIRVISPGHDEIIIGKNEAKQITQKVEQQEIKLIEPSPFFVKELKHSKVLFYWYQTRFDTEKINSGNQGVVNSIDKNPKKVIFADDPSDTKHQMTTTNPNLNKDWQEVGYIVDLELIVNGEKIVAYKILKNYPEDSIIE